MKGIKTKSRYFLWKSWIPLWVPTYWPLAFSTPRVLNHPFHRALPCVFPLVFLFLFLLVIIPALSATRGIAQGFFLGNHSWLCSGFLSFLLGYWAPKLTGKEKKNVKPRPQNRIMFPLWAFLFNFRWVLPLFLLDESPQPPEVYGFPCIELCTALCVTPFPGVFFAISSKLLLQVSQCLFPFVTP